MTTLTAETAVESIESHDDNSVLDLETLMDENEQETVVQEQITIEPLTGAALLRRAAQCSEDNLSAKDSAINCGYFTVDDKGTQRAQVAKFYKVLVAAKGLDFSGNASKTKRRGRKATQEITVHKNKSVVISGAYTELMNWEPGDVLIVKTGKNGLRLLKKDTDENIMSVDQGDDDSDGTVMLLENENNINGHQVVNENDEDEYDDEDD